MTTRALTRGLIGLLLGGVLLMGSCASPATGLVDGRLRPCPDRPNCVSSQEPGAAAVAPLPFSGEATAALDALQSLLLAQPRTELRSREEAYLHVTFTTPWLRFTDDVEFLADPAAGVIHVRSASRWGYSDLGLNRRRVEALAEAWAARVEAPDPDATQLGLPGPASPEAPGS
jgi:uncharacterized protein (DUF1499 family)